MSCKTLDATATPDAEECARLKEFKQFLRASGDVHAVTSVVEQRRNNETYVVTADELNAEVIMAIWTQLQVKRCPQNFQLALLRAATVEVEQDCHSAKDCNYACVAAGKDAQTATEAADERQFDLVKLQKFVANNLEKLLTRLNDNAEANKLQNYADVGALCGPGEKCNCPPLPNTNYVVGHIKNKPRKMEDRHVCLEHFSALYKLKNNYSFYGVFDGHSGSMAACYAASQLPQLLAERLSMPTDVQLDDDDAASYRESFESCFLQTDRRFANKRISSGCTAVCALISHGTPHAKLYVAWVGDSKALLVSPTAKLQLVKAHKPDSPEERKRIETSADAGGAVMFVQGQWRVNGILNVSRSIGDFSVSAVIAEPDFVDVDLMPAHDFLVLGSDGLWDHVPESTIVETIYQTLANAADKVEDIPKLLIDLAKQGDSQDNITVVVVFLKERVKIVESYKSK